MHSFNGAFVRTPQSTHSALTNGHYRLAMWLTPVREAFLFPRLISTSGQWPSVGASCSQSLFISTQLALGFWTLSFLSDIHHLVSLPQRLFRQVWESWGVPGACVKGVSSPHGPSWSLWVSCWSQGISFPEFISAVMSTLTFFFGRMGWGKEWVIMGAELDSIGAEQPGFCVTHSKSVIPLWLPWWCQWSCKVHT